MWNAPTGTKKGMGNVCLASLEMEFNARKCIFARGCVAFIRQTCHQMLFCVDEVLYLVFEGKRPHCVFS